MNVFMLLWHNGVFCLLGKDVGVCWKRLLNVTALCTRGTVYVTELVLLLLSIHQDEFLYDVVALIR